MTEYKLDTIIDEVLDQLAESGTGTKIRSNSLRIKAEQVLRRAFMDWLADIEICTYCRDDIIECTDCRDDILECIDCISRIKE
jgi:hypothetical protein